MWEGADILYLAVNNVMKELYLDLHFCDPSIEQEIRHHCSVFATFDHVKPSPMRQKEQHGIIAMLI